MGQMRDLIGAQRATSAGMLGPAEHSRLEEGAVDDQLLAALEQVEQAGHILHLSCEAFNAGLASGSPVVTGHPQRSGTRQCSSLGSVGATVRHRSGVAL